MKIIRPLQLSFNHQVLEQNRKFYFIASATLGVNLRTGEELLELDSIKDAMECIGDSALPDTGMPKPNGEVLVTGKCFAPDQRPVPAHQVSFNVGPVAKTLYVFGDRYWRRKGGLVKVISDREPFTEMDLSYENAFGGEGFAKNPKGKGMPIKIETGETVQPLPNIEDPNHLIGSPNDTPEPASFGPLDPARPQRMRFSGTYDDTYLQKYYPGYPEDLDWRYFLCAPKDQWIKDYFIGNEAFEIQNMHPRIPLIKGTLPGLYARCFILHTINGPDPEFSELEMKLDTIWLFPEKLLALLIWRKGIEVSDDEGEEITHVLGAYEDRAHDTRSLEYYRRALELRLNSDDTFLNNLNTYDLVPVGHKCAMELLTEEALGNGEESEFGKNIDAKAESLKKEADEKVDEALQKVEKEMEGMEVPGDKKPDLKKMIKEAAEAKPDPDVQAMRDKLELLLPGIMAGDPKKIDFKEFSFKKMDQMFDAMGEMVDKKEKEVKDLAKEEITKVKDLIKDQLENIREETGEMPGESKEKLEATLEQLENLDIDEVPQAPLPRVKADEMIERVSRVSPQIMTAIQHLEASKQTGGVENEISRDMEKQVREAMDTQIKTTEKALHEAQQAFKEGYFMTAHFMKQGLSPHQEPLEKVAERLLQAIASGQDVSSGDWACIDLSNQDLDGVDLSGSFLEQVNFTGASLKGANLSGSIMARAVLDDADLSGANLESANVGAVHAHRALFKDANLKSAKLSKGDFTDADFSGSELEDVESLEIIVNGTNFCSAHMPEMKFLESELMGTKFSKADLCATVFLDCDIKDAEFIGANMTRCIFADSRLTKTNFDGADLTSACFVAADPEKMLMKNLRFRGACLKQANFQDLSMPGTDLSRANLENSNFGGADLSDADLSRAYAKMAVFRKARLAGAKLDVINLVQASLAKAYLVNASFVGANLYAADFLRSTITNTDFRGSNLELTLIEHWRPE